jgi:hypothetical protein
MIIRPQNQLLKQTMKFGLAPLAFARRMRPVLILLLLLGSMSLEKKEFMSVANAGGESPKEVLAAQIRSQGVVCEKPTRAVRDVKRSRPDHDVWVLTCKKRDLSGQPLS